MLPFAYASSNKTKIVSFETELFFFSFLPGDARLLPVFWRVLIASVDICAEIEFLFSGVTKSGRVRRKVPESDARSVGWVTYTPSIAFRHLPPWRKNVVKHCLESGMTVTT